MFDVGFWEITLIGLITLMVVGPERLPVLAQKAGRYMNKIRHFLTDVKSQVDQEINTSDIQNLKQHLSFEDEKHSILEVVKETQDDIKPSKIAPKDDDNHSNSNKQSSS